VLSWWSEQRDWCCPTFRELHEARYGRDLFLFVRPPGWASTTAPSFWLAFRSVRQCDLARLPVRVAPPDEPVTISTYRRIANCPGCGAELERFYWRRWEQLLDPVIMQEFELPTSTANSPGGALEREQD
jgi:hypothetical protein